MLPAFAENKIDDMNRPLSVNTLSVPPASQPIVAVARAVAELRRGGMVVMDDGHGAMAVLLAAEAANEDTLAHLAVLAQGRAGLALTRRRADVLALPPTTGEAVVIDLESGVAADAIHALADPCALTPVPLPGGLAVTGAAADSLAGGAVALAKLARLLPAVVVAWPPADGQATLAARHDLLTVAVADVRAYPLATARTLRPVSSARVPLVAAEDVRIVAFRPADGGIEHLAIIIGEPDPESPVLTRLHSECFTGDLLGSLRCDCGDQLRGAIAEIAQDGAGVLLYLAQEGRGIGLVNKLRAYQLQDDGFDTLDANGQLGFDDDERIYLPAAEMLRQLGIRKVRLLTNNPEKVRSLARHEVEVTERVPHVFPANDHNEYYLRTKATKGGHLF